ncbi:hypothetical protein [Streptomyces sp. NPDC087437]|uniref:hypothetical protein n=1 Tax=Streptomyces sp. NPDC087437 TaxID=3365789 RepID=UPI0037FEF08C
MSPAPIDPRTRTVVRAIDALTTQVKRIADTVSRAADARQDDFALTPDAANDAPPTSVTEDRQPAYAAVYAYIHRLDDVMPTSRIDRNAIIWHAVNAALDAHAEARDDEAMPCSAQHHGFDDGRLCIRAAQHHGDHIDERGYHWSDTVAMYPAFDEPLREAPAADGTCRSVEVDGEPVLVRGSGDFTEQDAHFLGEVVRAAKRRYETEHAPAADEGTQRTTRRNSLLNLLDRLDRTRTLTGEERALLRRHVQDDGIEADTTRERARKAERQVAEYRSAEKQHQAAADIARQPGISHTDAAQALAAIIAPTQRAEQAEAELDNLRGETATAKTKLSDMASNRNGWWERARELEDRADRYRAAWVNARTRAATLSDELTRRAPLTGQYAATLYRVRALLPEAPVDDYLAAGIRPAHLRSALDGTSLPDQEQGMPVDWQAIAQQRERELKTIGEQKHAAEQRAESAARVGTQHMADSERYQAERNGAYRERAHLLAWLATLYAPNAVLAPAADIDDEDGWHLLFLTVAGRQLSWHIAPRDIELFHHVERVNVADPRAQWDGHTTDEKYERIRTLPWGAMRYAILPTTKETPNAQH